jgi:hypothetical protein
MKVLRCLGVNGALHIQAIQEKTGLNYATTHRSIKRLERINLVWLSNIAPRGPKGAQTYSLTPYGILELYLRGHLSEDIAKIINNWRQATPVYIINHEKIESDEEIKELLTTTYPNIVSPMNTHKPLSWTDRFVIIQRNVLGTILFEEIQRQRKTHLLDGMVDVIQKDPIFLKTWETWFGVKKIVFHNLENINNEIHDKNLQNHNRNNRFLL